MPTYKYPVTIAGHPTVDTLLTLDVVFTPVGVFTDVDRVVNITLVNGTALEPIPYHYVTGGANTLSIVNITSNTIYVIFNDPTGLWIEGFSVANPDLWEYSRTADVDLLLKYNALHNFYNNDGTDINDDRNYTSSFRTLKFGYTEKSMVDLKLQPAYDASVNMIFTVDDGTPMRIVNSRFSINESGTIASIIDRRARKDANTYSDQNFHQTELIPKSISIPTLTFNGLVTGGILPGGGYRYFFKYVTADGAETDTIEESRLVSVHEGTTTLNSVGSFKPTSQAAKFTLSDLDQSFYGVMVYYTVSTGEVDSIDTAYKILSPYIIENDGTCTITHTGYESTGLVNIESLSLTYSIISKSKTLDVVNNRLLVGNTDALDVYDDVLASTATALMVNEGEFDIVHSNDLAKASLTIDEQNYSNPKFIYDSLGYWKGETYEIGIVFITDKGTSPVYPVQGIDKILGSATNYNQDVLGGVYRGFLDHDGQNSAGIFRTENRTDLWSYANNKLTFSGTNLSIDITALGTSDIVSKNVKGFFFVRRRRKKDALVQGLMTPVAAVPISSKFGSEYEVSGKGNWCGVGVTSSVAGGNVKFVPAPGGLMAFGVEEVDKGLTVYQDAKTSGGVAIVTNGATVASSTVYLTPTIEGIKVGSKLKFVGFADGTVSSTNYALASVTLATPVTVPGGTTVQIGQNAANGISGDFYTRAPIRDYALQKSWALYSPDVDCAPSYYASIFSGNKLGISCPKRTFTTEEVVNAAGQASPASINNILYHKITGTPSAASPLTGDRSAYASFVDTGAIGAAPKGFAGSTDRNYYLYWGWNVGSTNLTKAVITGQIAAATDQFSPGNPVGLEIGNRPGNSLTFGRYLGLKLDGYPSTSIELNALTLTPSATEKNLNAYNSIVGIGSLDAGPTPTPQLGFVSTIYNSNAGDPIATEAWKSRYIADEDSEYVAITKRFRFKDYFDEVTGAPLFDHAGMTIPIYGGDCFLGLSWKQVFQPLGISEAPQATDINTYKTTRRSLGLLSYGYAIPVPAQSNYNFNVRVKERVDEREYKVYGTDRSFLPLRGKDSIRGSKQYETGAYNHGYNAQDKSAFKQFRLNLNAPFYKFKYPNRIYVSSESNENEFINGFTNFKGLNFKDYNTDLGAITKLISLNNVLICVFRDGVAQIGIDERTVLSQDTGGVFVDAANVLSRSNVLNSDYGCSHLHGVAVSNNFAYGGDFARQKIWRTNGQAFEIISDLKVQNKINSIVKELTNIISGHEATMWIDVFTHFDSRKNELYFTFAVVDPDAVLITNKTKARTIVFNETTQLWICETNDVRKFIFQSNENRYAFPTIPGEYGTLWKYQTINQSSDSMVDVFAEYNKFYGTIYDMYYDYHVLDEQALYKIYNNIFIVGNNSMPSSITYSSDFNFLTTQALKSYTNVRYPMRAINRDPILATGTQGTQILTLSAAPKQIRATQRDLAYGDFISIIGANTHDTYRYVVISYNPSTLQVTVDKLLPLGGFVNKQLYFGYGSGLPLRLTDATFEENFGVISCQFNNRTTNGMSASKLRGKWMRFRHLYEGTAPVYISGIITAYGISLS